VWRTLGALPAAATLLGDIAKGFAAVSVARAADRAPVWAAAGAVLAIGGHCWPVFLRFRGGKGVATAFGAFLALAPLATAPAALVWVMVVASFRYVSLGSIMACVCLPLGVAVLGYPRASTAAAAIAAIIIIYRHRENLGRLLAGNERRLGDRAASA
jgi:glycerol-3-phosphate acyltransferase PlsY